MEQGKETMQEKDDTREKRTKAKQSRTSALGKFSYAKAEIHFGSPKKQAQGGNVPSLQANVLLSEVEKQM